MSSFRWLLRPQLVGLSSQYLHRAPIRNLTLAYTLHEPPGDNENDTEPSPIIILHGLFGSKQNNRSISKILARTLKTKVYALDLRNHGDSPQHHLHTYSSMADDVEEFIGTHNLDRPTLIGHSMGAKTAMTVALRSPSLVGTLIPVDNAPVDATLKSNFGRYVQGMRRILELKVSKRIDANKILEDYEPTLAIRQFLLTNLKENPDTQVLEFRIPVQTLGMSLDQMGAFPFNNPATARYDGPTLFIRGTRSNYVPDDILPLIGQFFPLFEVQDIESGHWVISEQPGPFTEAVIRFLTRKD